MHTTPPRCGSSNVTDLYCDRCICIKRPIACRDRLPPLGQKNCAETPEIPTSIGSPSAQDIQILFTNHSSHPRPATRSPVGAICGSSSSNSSPLVINVMQNVPVLGTSTSSLVTPTPRPPISRPNTFRNPGHHYWRSTPNFRGRPRIYRLCRGPGMCINTV